MLPAGAYPVPMLDSALATRGCQLVRYLGYAPYMLVDCGDGADMRALIADFSGDGVWVEADFYEQEDDTFDPAEAYDVSDSQWHHGNRGQVIDEVAGIPGADIRTLLAWQITAGDADAPMIAAIDSGLDPDHPDFRDMLFRNFNEICGNGLDDDDNGYVDDCQGWDIGDGDPDPTPVTLPEEKESGSTCKSWHGHFMSGIAAARGDNGVGTSGVIWGGKILNLKKHDDTACSSSTSDSIEAVAYAQAMGARIMLLSFSTRSYSKNFFDTLIAGEHAGVLFVMSAGNDGEDIDGQDRFPAAYPLPNSLVVANSNNRDELSGSSNWGSDLVDLAAPGTDLIGPEPGGDWGLHSGTSYAGPMVGGVAALLWATYPMMTAKQVRRAILEGARPIAALDCEVSEACVASGGRLDAYGALDAAAMILGVSRIEIDDLVVADEDQDGKLTPGERVTVSWALSNKGAASSTLTAAVQVIEENSPLVEVQNNIALPPLAFGERIAVQGEGDQIVFAIDNACSRNSTASTSFIVRDAQGGLWARDLAIEVFCEVDLDLDGVKRPADCADDDPARSPSAVEVCDGVDNDCDGLVDEPESEDARFFYVDEDGDGAGNPDLLTVACEAPSDMFVAEGNDCDDADPEVGPYTEDGGEERCGLLPEIAAKRAGSPQSPTLLCSMSALPGEREDPLVPIALLLLCGVVRRQKRS